MPTKRRPISRPSRRLPEAIELLLRGEPIENTPDNKQALIGAIWFREHHDVITEADRQRALSVLGEWRRPEREAMYQAELAHYAEIIRRRSEQ
jgi:hypothetical protein